MARRTYNEATVTYGAANDYYNGIDEQTLGSRTVLIK